MALRHVSEPLRTVIKDADAARKGRVPLAHRIAHGALYAVAWALALLIIVGAAWFVAASAIALFR